MIKKVGDQFKLIVIIVKSDLSRDVIQACKAAGAAGGTCFSGKGKGVRDSSSFLGVKIEPVKSVILSLVPDEIVDEVLAKVTKDVRLDKPGTGIAIVLNSKNVTGIAHLLKKDF